MRRYRRKKDLPTVYGGGTAGTKQNGTRRGRRRKVACPATITLLLDARARALLEEQARLAGRSLSDYVRALLYQVVGFNPDEGGGHDED